jgi:hypothetical protein
MLLLWLNFKDQWNWSYSTSSDVLPVGAEHCRSGQHALPKQGCEPCWCLDTVSVIDMRIVRMVLSPLVMGLICGCVGHAGGGGCGSDADGLGQVAACFGSGKGPLSRGCACGFPGGDWCGEEGEPAPAPPACKMLLSTLLHAWPLWCTQMTMCCTSTRCHGRARGLSLDKGTPAGRDLCIKIGSQATSWWGVAEMSRLHQ